MSFVKGWIFFLNFEKNSGFCSRKLLSKRRNLALYVPPDTFFDKFWRFSAVFLLKTHVFFISYSSVEEKLPLVLRGGMFVGCNSETRNLFRDTWARKWYFSCLELGSTSSLRRPRPLIGSEADRGWQRPSARSPGILDGESRRRGPVPGLGGPAASRGRPRARCGLWMVESDHVTRILASDWLVESGTPETPAPAWMNI